ncbi:MAG: Cof-type HAD-IIB family hydrolase [Acidobacteriota bacterium]
MPQPIKLVISDIDGTLITSNHEITEATKATANKLYGAGISLSLASSRPPRSMFPLARELNLHLPFASFNGALILTMDGEIKLRSALPAEITAHIKAIADEVGIGVWLYDETGWWAKSRDAFTEREIHTSGFEPDFAGYDDKLKDSLVKLTVVGKPELVAVAEQRVLAELGNEVSASKSKPRFLDVTARGFHKGSVVEHLATVFNVPKTQIAVIGDGPNDVVMFEQAGVSIAMGQAVDEVVDAATYITSSNDNEGWARGIDKYVLQA